MAPPGAGLPGQSLRRAYLRECAVQQVRKPNSGLLALLPDDATQSGDLDEIDLSDNVVGPKGLRCLFPAIASAPNLQRILVPGNQLTNEVVRDLCRVLRTHRGITELDVSDNCITADAGRELLLLARSNPNVVSIETTGTIIRPLMTNCLAMQLERNARRAAPDDPTTQWRTFSFGATFEGEDRDELTQRRMDLEAITPMSARKAVLVEDPSPSPDPATAGFAARGRRKTVSACSVDPDAAKDFQVKEYPKTPEAAAFLRTALGQHSLFAHLDDRELAQVIAAFRGVDEFCAGDFVYQQGDYAEAGDCLYVVLSGSCEVVKDNAVTARRTVGEIFGEEEVMYCKARDHSVRVTSPSLEVYTMDRETYQHLMVRTFASKRALHYDALRVGFLKNLTHAEKLQVADALEPCQFQDGEFLIHYDEEGMWFYIILEGRVEVYGRDAQKEPLKVCEFGPGAFVGELEFLHHHRTVADVRAKGPCRCLRMSRLHFELCMGPVLEIFERNAGEENPDYQYYRMTTGRGYDVSATLSPVGSPTARESPMWGQTNPSSGGKHSPEKISDGTEDGRHIHWPDDLTAKPSATLKVPQVGFSFGRLPSDAGDDPEDNDDADGAESPSQSLPSTPPAAHTRRATVMNERLDQQRVATFVPVPVAKSLEEAARLRRILEGNILFRHLDDRELTLAVGAMFPLEAAAGDVLQAEGPLPPDKNRFLVVVTGELIVEKNGVRIKTVPAGETYGEVELMYSQPDSPLIRAVAATSCWAMDRETYRYLVSGIFTKKRALYGEFLSKVGFLKPLSKGELLQLADALEPHNCSAGDYLIRYGEEGDWFYIILEGSVEVWGRDPTEKPICVCEFGVGDCVGELEFIHNHRTVADVVAKTDLRSARLNRVHFELCMGPVKEVLARAREADEKFTYYQKRRRHTQTMEDAASH